MAAIMSSILLSRTLFAKSGFFSPVKLITDCTVVFTSYLAAATFLSQTIAKDVQLSKSSYLKRFDADFLFHFNYLSAKYGIDEKMQVENIFNDKELEEWMDMFYQGISEEKI